MVYRRNTGRLAKAQQPASQAVTVPPSVGGVNALDPLIAMPPQDCIYTYNLLPSEYGLRLRQGYREWATGVGTTATEVRTIIPYSGHNTASDKLFAVTADGIYDVSLFNTTVPSREVVFSTTANDSGYMNWAEMTLDNDVQMLFAADAENGLYAYSEATGLWSTPLFTGPTVSNIAQVNLFKQRLWVVEDGEAYAYYSAVDSVAGLMTKFTFGSKFRYGGELVGTWTWTFDGGQGVNDFLVAVSRGGDVLLYQGSDPSLEDFEVIGAWYIGELPDSRNVAVQHGGEFYLLSTFGLVSLRDLVQGVGVSEADTPAKKINRILREDVISKKTDYGWSVRAHPSDGFLQIIAPYGSEPDAVQYTQNLQTSAWGYWRNVPAKCADTWNADYYIGSTDGRVFQYSGQLDNTTLAGEEGVAISFSTLTSFQPYGNHATQKMAGMFRVIGVTAGDTTYSIKSVYDYDLLAQAVDPLSPENVSGALWDAAIWDTSVWDAQLSGASQLFGGQNYGRTIAVAMKGESTSRVTIVGWDMTVTEGGFL